MKRLTLSVFKAKSDQPSNEVSMDQLLGQVLGNCHDGPTPIGEGDDDEDPIIQ